MDVVLYKVGGDTQQRSLRVLKPGGFSSLSCYPFPRQRKKHCGVRAPYFYVDVTPRRPNKITELFDSGKIVADLGTVFPVEEARSTHEMLGSAPYKRGKRPC